MKIFINKVTCLYAINSVSKVKDYKQGLTHTVNEWYEGNDPNGHYAAKYNCSEVFLQMFNKPAEVVQDSKGKYVIKPL